MEWKQILRIVCVALLLLSGLSSLFMPGSLARAAGTPFGGTPRAIPGTIQAEDFDNGGEGVAYHDTDTANTGGQYRTAERVDIQTTTDTGGGYNVGWIRTGEWLEYTVNVQTAGNYTLLARVASGVGTGSFHVDFAGVNKTGTVSVASTGGWQTWTTISRTVNLSAGQQVMRVAIDNLEFNLNYLSFSSASTTATPTRTATRTNTPVGPTTTPTRTSTRTNTPLGPTATPTRTATTSSGVVVKAINAGGAAAAPYVADTNFDVGNMYSDASSAINTAGDPNPAPQAVYQTVRWNATFTYTIPGLTAGAAYTVRLHWAELTWQSVGARRFNVAINSSNVLSAFDVFAAGGYKNAVARSFTTTANGSGQIVIAFTQGGADNPMISGIEIVSGSAPTATRTNTPTATRTNTPLGPTRTPTRTATPVAGALSQRVHLFYYPWYGNPTFSGSWVHWPQGSSIPPNDISSNFYPSLGAYDSGDSATVTQHMQWIQRSGAGVISLSWWGQGSYEDQRARLVMDIANQYGIKVDWHIEPYGGRTAASVVNDINYINSQYGGHPAFFRDSLHGNKPVFYIFYSLQIVDWSALDQVNANNIIFAQTTDLSRVAHFGGIYTYGGMDMTSSWTWLNDYCHSHGMLWAPSVQPGYIDDRAVPGNTVPNVDRNNGATYDAQWSRALDPAQVGTPDYVTVTSFNEWHEGSQIEPARNTPPSGFGYLTYMNAYGRTDATAELAYIDRTKYWVTQFSP